MEISVLISPVSWTRTQTNMYTLAPYLWVKFQNCDTSIDCNISFYIFRVLCPKIFFCHDCYYLFRFFISFNIRFICRHDLTFEWRFQLHLLLLLFFLLLIIPRSISSSFNWRLFVRSWTARWSHPKLSLSPVRAIAFNSHKCTWNQCFVEHFTLIACSFRSLFPYLLFLSFSISFLSVRGL